METEKPLTKKERRLLKKQRKKEQQRRTQQRKQQKKLFGHASIVIIVLLVVFGLWKMGSGTNSTGPAENLTALQPDDHTKGPDNALVTLIEYSDFQCPACERYYHWIKELHDEFPEELQIVFRHFPLTQLHEHALQAARAAEAAGKQGKFWEMHDKLFDEQHRWGNNNEVVPFFEGYAEELGLNVEQFTQDMSDATLKAKIDRDVTSGRGLRVTGTPTFFLNGTKVDLPNTIEDFKEMIRTTVGTGYYSEEVSITPESEPETGTTPETEEATEEEIEVQEDTP